MLGVDGLWSEIVVALGPGLCFEVWGWWGRCWWSVVDGLWAYLGAMLAHLGGYVAPRSRLCCPILGPCSPSLKPTLAHVDPPWATGPQKMRRGWWVGVGGLLFRVRGHILGPCWPIFGAMLPQVGGDVAPSWRYGRPAWGLCWPRLTHLEPQAPKKWEGVGGSVLAVCCLESVGISWDHVGPSSGLCCPKLEAMLPHLGATVAQLEAYVGPGWPI